METPNNGQNNPKRVDKPALISLSFELGYIIAIPLVIFALSGKWVDNHFHHSFPWVTLIGIGIAIFTTTIWLIQRLQKYIK
ncbi:MAG TPA: AtpZ/AtpI family protein [Methylomirabilota bacterium]|nr:AtpZ/AtpI family protein [Methylomirabilota bacterium]